MVDLYPRSFIQKIKLILKHKDIKKPAFSDTALFTSYGQLKLDGNWAIETMSFCNRNCPFCPGSIDEPVYRRRQIKNNKKKIKTKVRIPISKIICILDEIKEISTAKSPTILPFVLNEPYEDDRIVVILEEMKKRGFNVYMVSNGDVFQKNPELMSDSFPCLDRLKLGIYYNGSTIDGELKIKSKINYFKNKFDILAKKHRWRPQLEFSVSSDEFTIPESFLPQGRSVKYPCNLNVDGYRQISAFGDLSICCKDNSWEELGGVCLGNVFEKSIREIIFSQKHLKVLNILRQGDRHKLLRCATCISAIGIPDLDKEPSYWKVVHSQGNSREQLSNLLDRLNKDRKIRGSKFDFKSKDFTYDLKKGIEIWNENEQRWELS